MAINRVNTKKKKDSEDNKPGKIYVLVPLPSLDISKCVYTEGGFITLKGCNTNGELKKELYAELTELGSTLLKRLQMKKTRDVNPVLITFADVDILKNLSGNDVLYVTAHGFTTAIGNKEEGVDISAERLAKIFNDIPLSKNLRTIKIMCCNSALKKDNVKEAYGKALPNAPKSVSSESFIEVFQKNMKDYSNLDIIGYLGYISDIVKAKHKKDYHTVVQFFSIGNNNIRAKEASIILCSKNSKRDKYEIEEVNESHLSLLNLSNS